MDTRDEGKKREREKSNRWIRETSGRKEREKKRAIDRPERKKERMSTLFVW